MTSARLCGDMLSSQPLCFNLFGELALDLDLATEVLSLVWPRRIERRLALPRPVLSKERSHGQRTHLRFRSTL